MAFSVTSAPSYGQAGSYSALQDRLLVQANAVTAGVRKITPPAGGAMTGDLAVTVGVTASTVQIAAGDVWIYGGAGVGYYYAYNDGAITSPAFASNASGTPRIDIVWVQVTDSGSVSPTIAVGVTTGTPGTTPAAPTYPSKAVVLAQVLIPTGFTSGSTNVLAANIVDVRPKAQLHDLSVASLSNNLSVGRVDTPFALSPGELVFDVAASNIKTYSNWSHLGYATSGVGVAIGTGAKTFTVQNGLSLSAGQRVRLVSAASSTSNPFATSSTSNSIGGNQFVTASKTFTIAVGLTITATRLRVQSLANPANFMEGAFTYTSGTGALVLTSDTSGGSGTFTDWVVYAVPNYMEGAISSYSTTTLSVTVDATSGTGTFTDWLVYGPSWEQPMKAETSGTYDGSYRYVPVTVSPSNQAPTLPVLGAQWYQPDTGRAYICTATAPTPAWTVMGGTTSWQLWSPTFSGINGGTGPTQLYAYTQIGKTVHWRFQLTFGTSPSFTGAATFTLPVTPVTNTTPLAIGYYNGTGGPWLIHAYYSGGVMNLMYLKQTGVTTAGTGIPDGAMTTGSTPVAPAAGNILALSGTYEAA